MIEMTWFGGPQDGAVLEVRGEHRYGPIRVICGSSEHPEERYVTPRRLMDGRWILPFNEAKTKKQRRPDDDPRNTTGRSE